MDNILIHATTKLELEKTASVVTRCLEEAGLRLNPDKCMSA